MARKVGDCWPNADAVGKRHQRLVSSGPSGTEVLGCAGIGTSAYPACCTSFSLEHQANEARCAWNPSDRDRISMCHWQCVRPRSALVVACLLHSSAPQQRLQSHKWKHVDFQLCNVCQITNAIVTDNSVYHNSHNASVTEGVPVPLKIILMYIYLWFQMHDGIMMWRSQQWSPHHNSHPCP